MTIKETIKEILKDKQTTQAHLAEKLGVAKNNLNNKMQRDNFSTIELVEIADALKLKLLFRDEETKKDYPIEYPEELKGKPKRINKSNSMKMLNINIGVNLNYGIFTRRII